MQLNTSFEKYKNIQYLKELPSNFSGDKKYPLIIHFHGAGSRGEDLNVLKSEDLLKYKSSAKEFPFVVIMPLCFADTWFDMYEQVKDFVSYISTLSYIDKSRIYLSGISMGGYCAWQLLTSLNEIFAASVICCGGGMYWNAKKVKCPVWAFHGELDDAVYTNESRYYVDRINVYGGEAKLTTYPNVWHDCWAQTYSNPEIYTWLLSKIKED